MGQMQVNFILFIFFLSLSQARPQTSFSIASSSPSSSLSPPPLVYWVSQPVYPNQTVLVFGDGLLDATVSLCDIQNSNCISATVLDNWESSIKFLIPDSAKFSAYSFEVCQDSSCSEFVDLNVPEVWWLESDEGEDATEWTRIFGRSLAFENEGCVVGSSPSNNTGSFVILENGATRYNITDVLATCYDLYFELPSEIVPGVYNVSVANSLSNKAATILRDGSPLQLSVITPPSQPSITFDVRKQFNGNLTAAVDAANAAGGGIVYISSGDSIYMKDQEILTLNDSVYLFGDGPSLSQVYWQANSAIPPAALITTWGRFGIQSIGLYAPSPSKAVIHVTSTSSGFIRSSVASRSSPTDIENVFQIDGNNVEVSNNYFSHSGNCSAVGWPGNCGFWLNTTSHTRLIQNSFSLHCQGYAGFGVDRLLMLENTIISSSNITSDGSGFSTLGRKMYTEKVSVIRNYHQGDFDAPVRYETYTSDGPGAAYFGVIVESNSTEAILELSANATFGNSNYTRAGIVVLNGTGAGQVRRIASCSTTGFSLETPLDVPLDSSSVISIIPYRAELILAGNYWKNGTAVQIFGASFFSVIADNTLDYMLESKQIHPAGIASWGLDYGGVQPSYFTEILGNNLIDAGAITGEASGANRFVGPYLRAHIIRGNILTLTSFINIMGTSSDFVIENNSISGLLANQTAIQVAATANHILIR